MEGFIPDDIVERVRSTMDILDVVGEYVALKRSGANHTGLCPFHQEKTPSFSVNQAKQIYHCFGCGAGGDAVGFLMRYDNLSFPEAIRRLADKLGIIIPETGRPNRNRPNNEPLYKINEQAAIFFAERLADKDAGRKAREYLAGRGIDDLAVAEFGFGYAPDAWDGIIKHLAEKGVDEKTLVLAGLAVEKTKGEGCYDRFRDRLMFPIKDQVGRVVGFGGRVMGDGEPKYLNSPETPIFTKGDQLYALDKAGSNIRKRGYAVVTEGYTDAIACHRAGVTHAVATLGTALTPAHLRAIGRYAKKVLLVFDSDEAGKKAAERSLDVFLETKMKAKVAMLPRGDDPDSMVGSGRTGALVECLKASIPLMDYVIDRLAERARTLEGKVEAAARMVDILARVTNAVERGHYLKAASGKLDIEKGALAEELEKAMDKAAKRASARSARGPGATGGPGGARGPNGSRSAAGKFGGGQDNPPEYDYGGQDEYGDAPPPEQYYDEGENADRRAERPTGGARARAGKRPGNAAERVLVNLMLRHPELALRIRDELGPEEFIDPVMVGLAKMIYEALDDDGMLDVQPLIDRLEDGPAKMLLLELRGKNAGDAEDLDALAEGSIRRLRMDRVNAGLKEIDGLISKAADDGDDVLLRKYQEQQIALTTKKLDLQKK